MMIEKSGYNSSSSYVEKQQSSREQKRSSKEVFQPVVSNNIQQHLAAKMPEVSFSLGAARKAVNTWMAFEDDTACNMKNPNGKSFEGIKNHDYNASNGLSSDVLNSSDDGDRSGNSSERFVQESAMASGESCYNSDSGEFSRVSQELKDALATLQQTFVVCDASKPDCPIVYASKGFFSMSGYPSDEVIGKNWRFLEGPETDQTEVIKFRTTLKKGRSYSGKLLNYKKDGTPFWNLLTISPIKHHNNPSTLYFIGMQVVVCEYSEGVNDEDLITNRLPELMIQSNEEEALDYANELIQTVKHPRSHVWDTTQVVKEEMENLNLEFVLPESAKLKRLSTPGGEVTKFSSEREMSSTPENSKKDENTVQISSWSLKKSTCSLWKLGQPSIEPEVLMTNKVEKLDIWDQPESERNILQGIKLACTLELIKRNFVITDPRLPDNPIIYASNSFLKLTEYTRNEVLGRNCSFLQGPQTDQVVVAEIRDAIKEQREITIQLINYTKSGKKFWNLFHLQPTYDQKGRLQYFIGVQIDGNDHAAFHLTCVSKKTKQESANIGKAIAEDVDKCIRDFPDAILDPRSQQMLNKRPEDLLAFHSEPVFPHPHKRETASWLAIQKITKRRDKIGLHHFEPIKPLGCGDTGSVHLVKLKDTGELFAMKAMEKSILVNYNKVHRACIEREIMSQLDHPFLLTLYASFQTCAHVCLITDYFPGGELFNLLDKQPMKILEEEYARFYAAEVVICLEYLHCSGVIYRDLKPENILLQQDGHIVLTDFDLSFLTSCKPQILKHPRRANRRSRSQLAPMCVAEPVTESNSFVGTEEYIAPEVITGGCHTSAMDWWALGILLYEMLYGRTPFKGKNRQKTFANILHKDLTFPSSIQVSLAARQLINALLQRDPTSRLGSISGAYEIRQHSFFRGINWPLIRCMSPPPLNEFLQLPEKDPDTW